MQVTSGNSSSKVLQLAYSHPLKTGMEHGQKNKPASEKRCPPFSHMYSAQPRFRDLPAKSDFLKVKPPLEIEES